MKIFIQFESIYLDIVQTLDKCALPGESKRYLVYKKFIQLLKCCIFDADIENHIQL